MNVPDENPYAPPQAETTRLQTAVRIPMVIRILLGFDVLLMLWILFDAIRMLWEAYLAWTVNIADVIILADLIRTPAYIVYFTAFLLFFPIGLCGFVGDVFLLLGNLRGAFPSRIRILLAGAVIGCMVGMNAISWGVRKADFEDLWWRTVIWVLCAFWWLAHWIVVREVIGRIVAQHTPFEEHSEL